MSLPEMIETNCETAYSRAQYDDNYPDGIEHHWWNRARAEIILEAIAVYKKSRILDVGCGRGYTVHFLRSRGFDCLGCEPANPVVESSVKDFVATGIDACNLDPELRAHIDVLMMLDVVEHIADPHAFLRNLLSAFPNATQVVLTVPARWELWSVWDERYGHYRRYDRRMLHELLTSARLEIFQMRYIFQSLYPILLLASRTGTRAAKVKSPRHIWMHRLIARWFSAEAQLLSIPGLWGTSLLAVCKRRPVC